MNHNQAASWVERLKEARILVVGDVMLDRFVHGSIDRISPEAPVSILRSESTSLALGGAGNVVRNLSALGCRTSFVTIAGRDAAAAEVKRLLGELPGLEWALFQEDQRPTTEKTRFIADRQQLLRVDSESCRPLQSNSCEQVLRHVSSQIEGCDAVLLSDYAKGVLSEAVLEGVLEAARRQGCTVLVDPKGHDYSRYRGAGILTPNLKELGLATVGEALCDDEQVIEAARLLIESCALQAVLVTRGADGMSLVESSGRTTRLKAQAREVFDVSGAGDTVIAVMAAAIASGAPLPQAAELSNLAAGIVVGKVGTAVTRADDLLQALHQRDLGRAEAKVLSRQQAREQMEIWRRQGRSAGFTNGVFDLLHPGHLAVLRRASEECDRLIVGLNGDASVHLLKGSGPVQNEATRSTILASLEMVDAVVVFQEETPLPLLEALQPDALIKGANYRLDEVVGGDLVRSWGGRVVLAQIQDNPSAAIAELTEGTF